MGGFYINFYFKNIEYDDGFYGGEFSSPDSDCQSLYGGLTEDSKKTAASVKMRARSATKPFNVSILFNDCREGCRFEYIYCHGL